MKADNIFDKANVSKVDNYDHRVKDIPAHSMRGDAFYTL